MRSFDLIAFDLDGTVFFHPTRQETTARVAQAFEAAHDAGVTLVVASGRPTWMLGPQIPTVPWVDWAVGANGAQVAPLGRNSSSERLCLPIDRAIALPFMREVERLGGGIELHTQSESMQNAVGMERFAKRGAEIFKDATGEEPGEAEPGHNPIAEFMKTLSFTVVDSAAEAMEKDPSMQACKLDIDLPSIEACDEVASLAASYGTLEVARVGTHAIEVTAAGSSKGNGIAWLCERLGIDPSRVVAFGDSGNDLSMAGREFMFVAMGNAPANVKAAANEVCDTVRNDGVAKWIEAHL